MSVHQKVGRSEMGVVFGDSPALNPGNFFRQGMDRWHIPAGSKTDPLGFAFGDLDFSNRIVPTKPPYLIIPPTKVAP